MNWKPADFSSSFSVPSSAFHGRVGDDDEVAEAAQSRGVEGGEALFGDYRDDDGARLRAVVCELLGDAEALLAVEGAVDVDDQRFAPALQKLGDAVGHRGVAQRLRCEQVQRAMWVRL